MQHHEQSRHLATLLPKSLLEGITGKTATHHEYLCVQEDEGYLCNNLCCTLATLSLHTIDEAISRQIDKVVHDVMWDCVEPKINRIVAQIVEDKILPNLENMARKVTLNKIYELHVVCTSVTFAQCLLTCRAHLVKMFNKGKEKAHTHWPPASPASKAMSDGPPPLV